ncbi:MAG: dTDP-4-amino-4,6-dideoxygalactose transaminase [Chloroflexota bacterium]|nr:dTDP-4-amino-4,6-dideoxygalactose transaminase [Chloroflexota bacterium]
MSAPTIRIPFNKPALMGSEISYIVDAVQKGHVSGDGAYTKKCHAALEALLGVPKVLLTTSCTHALEMAALMLDIQPGDEVIVPAFTFVSTINAFVLRGAVPVFADIRPDTLNMDETQLEALISPRTRAIVPVHYAGVGCEMDAIMAIAARHSIPVVEDNAHGLFGSYRGRALGTFGVLATQSFHETKNITCGEGGALVINDAAMIERAEIIREKGTNRSRFFRGQIDKYTWVDLGSSYLPSDVLAAYLYAQIEARDTIQAHRKNLWERYDETLMGWAGANSVTLPTIPSHCDQAYHMFYLLLPTLEARTALIAHLRERAISAVFHYLPLNLSEFGRKFGGKAGDCPVTESVSDRLLRLPFHNMLTADEQGDVIAAIQDFRL